MDMLDPLDSSPIDNNNVELKLEELEELEEFTGELNKIDVKPSKKSSKHH